MNRAQQASANRAKKLIDLYLDMSNSMSDICAAMGWKTDRPSQMVAAQMYRLRKRGYDVPLRSGLR